MSETYNPNRSKNINKLFLRCTLLQNDGRSLEATIILSALLEGLMPIW